VRDVYVLLITLDRGSSVDVDALGNVHFARGMYVYVGSSQNNLRVTRHLRKLKRKSWHIDYLLGCPTATIPNVLWTEANKQEECKIAHEMAKQGIAVKQFGCSDCTCESHSFKLADYEFLRAFMREIHLDSELQGA